MLVVVLDLAFWHYIPSDNSPATIEKIKIVSFGVPRLKVPVPSYFF